MYVDNTTACQYLSIENVFLSHFVTLILLTNFGWLDNFYSTDICGDFFELYSLVKLRTLTMF